MKTFTLSLALLVLPLYPLHRIGGSVVASPVFPDGSATTGGGNNALSLDGDGDYVTVPHDTSLSFTTQFSVSLWTRTDSLHLVSLIRKGQSDTPAWSLNNESGLFVFWLHVNGNWTRFPFSTVSAPGQWYYVTGAYDGSEVRLYVDGSLNSSFSQSFPVSTTSDSLYIGADPTGFGAFQQGAIDEVSIWNRALTAEQIGIAMTEIWGLRTTRRRIAGSWGTGNSTSWKIWASEETGPMM